MPAGDVMRVVDEYLAEQASAGDSSRSTISTDHLISPAFTASDSQLTLYRGIYSREYLVATSSPPRERATPAHALYCYPVAIASTSGAEDADRAALTAHSAIQTMKTMLGSIFGTQAKERPPSSRITSVADSLVMTYGTNQYSLVDKQAVYDERKSVLMVERESTNNQSSRVLAITGVPPSVVTGFWASVATDERPNGQQYSLLKARFKDLDRIYQATARTPAPNTQASSQDELCAD